MKISYPGTGQARGFQGVFPLTILVLFIGCSRLPPNIGRSRDIVVLASRLDTTRIINNFLRYNYVPQKEAVFSFFFAPDSLFNNYDKFHTLFLYGSLKDEFINVLLNPEAKQATQKDTFTLFKINDLWAKDQLVVILVAAEPEYIPTGITKYQEFISKIFEQNYYDRIKKNYYADRIDEKIKNQLKKFGITCDLKEGWLIDSTYQDEDFIFVHTHFPDRSIFFYKEKLKGELTDSFVIQKRDGLTKKYYNGDYILQELTSAERISFKGMTGIKLRGVWQNDSLVAGGPFLSYFLINKQNMFYVIDGMLFAPGERKSDYFTKLKVIMNSFEVINPVNSKLKVDQVKIKS